MKQAAASMLFVNSEGKALILQRGHDAPWEPHKWNLPGGIIEPEETPESGARREAQEESGLVAGEVDYFTFIESDEGWVVTVFRCTDYSGTVTLDYESQAEAWVTKDDLDNFDFVPSLRATLELLFEVYSG